MGRAQNTIADRVKALEVWQAAKAQSDKDQIAADRTLSDALLVDVTLRGDLAERLKKLDTGQADQNVQLVALGKLMSNLQLIGGGVALFTATVLGLFYFHANKRQKTIDDHAIARQKEIDANSKARELMETRLVALETAQAVAEAFKEQTDKQMPMVGKITDQFIAALGIELHHPDPSHVEADELLDLVGGPMTAVQKGKLKGLMLARANDPNIPMRERAAALALMPAIELSEEFNATLTPPSAQDSPLADKLPAGLVKK